MSRYELIDAEKAHYPVAWMCRQLEVSKSGYFVWSTRGPSERTRRDQELVPRIRKIFSQHRRRYGSRRVHKELIARGEKVGLRRVERLMRQEGLQARGRRRFRKTTDSAHSFPVAPNVLEREFSVSKPNQVWAGDITYIWTAEGWLYLAVLLDLFSRKVIGWAMSDRITRKLALDALVMAIGRRGAPQGLLHHSDRGSQYASKDYRKLLSAHGIACSMSRKGDCWDNAVSESFFASLEKELLIDAAFLRRDDARREVFEYIEAYYNRERRHSTLGYVSPFEYEQVHAAAFELATHASPILEADQAPAFIEGPLRGEGPIPANLIPVANRVPSPEAITHQIVIN